MMYLSICICCTYTCILYTKYIYIYTRYMYILMWVTVDIRHFICNYIHYFVQSAYHHPPLFFSHDFYRACSVTLSRQQEKAAQVKGILQMDKWRGIPNKTPLQPLGGCVKRMIKSLVVEIVIPVEIIRCPWITALSLWNLKGVLKVTMCASLFFKISQKGYQNLPTSQTRSLSILPYGPLGTVWFAIRG